MRNVHKVWDMFGLRSEVYSGIFYDDCSLKVRFGKRDVLVVVTFVKCQAHNGLIIRK